MPPIVKPRSANLSRTDESINEEENLATPQISQPRARRLQQKTAPSNNEISALPTPPVKIVNSNEEKGKKLINNAFIEKIRNNDTLARFRRDGSSPTPGSQSDGIVICLSNEKYFDLNFLLSLDNSVPPSSLSARERRRQHRVNTTTTLTEDDDQPPRTPPVYDRSISNDSQIDVVEQERKAKNEMKDLLNQLDATLRSPAPSAASVEVPKEIPNLLDLTITSTLKIQERYDAIKQSCLKEISVEAFKKVLDLVDRVDNTEIKEQMISILGKELYDKYGGQIYYFKYYENSLITRK